jgi:phosphatidylserine decarboxylase
MTARDLFTRLMRQEDLNFLLTNRIPRQLLTRFMGWFSQIEQPQIRDLSIGLWKYFSDLDLSDAKKTRFRSLHDCFTRQLKDGARPVESNPGVVTSPCDAIVGACGRLDGIDLIQAKGHPYTLSELLCDPALVEAYRNGCYVTLRLTATMYHRFHAPYDCRVEQVTYISGDVWNVNSIALKRVEKLFCKNERAVIRTRLKGKGHLVTLVPVAAVLVASIRLHFLNILLHLRHRGPNVMPCDAPMRKGEEMGWFQHGSTIIIFAPEGFELCAGVQPGAILRMGRPLLRLPEESITE